MNRRSSNNQNLHRILVWREDVPFRVQRALCTRLGLHPPQARLPHRRPRLPQLRPSLLPRKQLQRAHRPRILQLAPQLRLPPPPYPPIPLSSTLPRRPALLQPRARQASRAFCAPARASPRNDGVWRGGRRDCCCPDRRAAGNSARRPRMGAQPGRDDCRTGR